MNSEQVEAKTINSGLEQDDVSPMFQDPGNEPSRQTSSFDFSIHENTTGSSAESKRKVPKQCAQCPGTPASPSLRQKIHMLFDHPASSNLATAIQTLGMSLILLSTIAFMLETVDSIAHSSAWVIIEHIVSILFTLEYLARLLCCNNIKAFLVHPANILDLLAIVPFYIGVSSPNVSGDIEALRIFRTIRVVRLFRLLRVTKYLKILSIFGRAILMSKEAFLVLIVVLMVTVVIAASIIYAVEKGTLDPRDGIHYRSDGSKSPYTSIPTSCYWAVTTLTTVG